MSRKRWAEAGATLPLSLSAPLHLRSSTSPSFEMSFSTVALGSPDRPSSLTPWKSALMCGATSHGRLPLERMSRSIVCETK